jgi:hypothetical protein
MMVMGYKYLPIYLFILAAGYKTLLIVLYRIYQSTIVIKLAITYDPIGYWMSSIITSFFYDQRRFAPAPGEDAFREIAIVIAFAIECAVLGLIVQMIIRKIQKSRKSELKPFKTNVAWP